MKPLIALLKKECLEQIRSGRMTVLSMIFVLVGIMNPATAKLTPWLLELMSNSLAESGMSVTITTITALDSWVQFFKNIPICLIAFLLIQSGIFTKEYTSGTLILSLTKGLSRMNVLISKTVVLILFWSVGYWSCVGITYGYTAYYWDNSIAQNLFVAVNLWWLFGIFVLSLSVLFSAVFNSNIGVLAGCGGIVLVSYLLSLIPKVNRYLPTLLTDGNALIYGTKEIKEYSIAILISICISLGCLLVSIPLLNKKQM